MEQNLSSFSSSKLDRVMTTEQFNQIVEAIISGKYSWACVLILRFAGYNPLHYIPYRTYNRLLKDNRLQSRPQEVVATSTVENKTVRKSKSIRNSSKQLQNLSYLEDLQEQSAKLRGSKGWDHYGPDFTLDPVQFSQ
ncbi:MAG: HetP family heterocyst commitment protein [Xenococcus sp. MO_188.B8]|nr:HetP family heterocyst commitment protein [Xenococcus sp. MO_188.B8]